MNWLTIQVRLAHDLSLLPARKSPFAGTFLAEADRNDVGSALARERFLDALLCEHQRLPRKLAIYSRTTAVRCALSLPGLLRRGGFERNAQPN